jgi:hypothetical protein
MVLCPARRVLTNKKLRVCAALVDATSQSGVHLVKHVLALSTALVVTASISLAGQGETTGGKLPPLMIASMHGGDLYNHYCASCHGKDGTGNGPAAQALRTTPPDLTRMARANGGVFPRGRAAAIIGGESSVPFVPSHGRRDMPVWGPIFRYLDANRRATDVRIENLVTYLESLQAR